MDPFVSVNDSYTVLQMLLFMRKGLEISFCPWEYQDENKHSVVVSENTWINGPKWHMHAPCTGVTCSTLCFGSLHTLHHSYAAGLDHSTHIELAYVLHQCLSKAVFNSLSGFAALLLWDYSCSQWDNIHSSLILGAGLPEF